jgi:hypothetical protein
MKSDIRSAEGFKSGDSVKPHLKDVAKADFYRPYKILMREARNKARESE